MGFDNMYCTCHIQGIWWHSWLGHCATCRKVTGSIPDGVFGVFLDIILPAAL